MTQPPDQRDPAAEDQPATDARPPGDEPTIAWAPPTASPMDAGAVPAVPVPLAPHAASNEPLEEPPTGQNSPSDPPSPIVSWAPSATPANTTPGPIVGWEVPSPTPLAVGQTGYVIAGVGARILAYFLDSLFIGITSAILLGIASAVTGRSFINDGTTLNQLFSILSLGIGFIYFVGFWTSGRQATPGMRVLSLRIGRVVDGAELPIESAVIRFVALGSVVGLLSFIPGLAVAASWLSLGLTLLLLITTLMHPLHQGLHDRWSGSLVVRTASASSRGFVLGCLLLIAILFILPIVALVLLGPDAREILSQIGASV